MVIKWIVGVILGYWLIGMVGIITCDSMIRRSVVHALWLVAYAFLWLPMYVMDVVERASARIKVDLVDEEDHTK